jgi:hypothetical protein
MANDVPVAFIDNPHAPDVFAAGATGFFNLQGTIVITLETPHVNHEASPGPINRVVVGRLVMPASGAYGLATGLFNFLKEQGFDFSANEGEPAKPN